ncbi:sensor histidine kinase [Agromyces aerolatus]|uniref:sensor histidine kinase n=1 Tax=Agromyces sp. LY-1074 TaxID=3074080 RepID=UPI00286164DB|nr:MULTISPECIES: sensor domain-containing protein [unclassified Agromyces]MDR5699870.1 sensor domain-containing protein [Agromyces sp. LY-1074]MDR5706318.1 sensor domain-containing protein [Agromyces sp. LY-1358]
MSTESQTGAIRAVASDAAVGAAQPDRSGHTVTPAEPRARLGYGRLWAAVPRELGFLILTMPIAIVGLTVLATVFFTGIGMVAIVIGIFLLVASLFVARGFGTLELIRLRWAGMPEVRRPDWSREGREQGFWRTTFTPFVDGHYWLYVLHTLVVNPIVSIVTWTFTVVWLSVALGGVTGWIWQPFIPDDERTFWLNQWIVERFVPGGDLAYNPVVGERILEFVLGVVFLLTLPFLFRGMTLLHDVIARGMLGAWRSEALERQVVALAASRGAAVQAEDASLRRLERDIHDGPQQRLVRLQMDLAAIERRLDQDPEQAKALVGEARDQAREALDELRALSRGFAPPLLQDRGLASALASLAARSPVPVTFDEALAAEAPLPAAIERNAYFIAAELLTNAAKHAEASAVRLRIATRDEGPAGQWLDLWVTDNGRGGAAATPGHGLAGLDERVRGLQGQFVVTSPIGGPTSIGAHIPYTPVA